MVHIMIEVHKEGYANNNEVDKSLDEAITSMPVVSLLFVNHIHVRKYWMALTVESDSDIMSINN